MPDSKPEAVSATALIDALIDARIASLQDWRGSRLASIRQWIKAADPEVIEEWIGSQRRTVCCLASVVDWWPIGQ